MTEEQIKEMAECYTKKYINHKMAIHDIFDLEVVQKDVTRLLVDFAIEVTKQLEAENELYSATLFEKEAEEAFKEWKSEQYKDQSTEEKMEYVEHLHCFPKYFEKTFKDGYNKAKDKIEALEERCEIANDEIIRLQKVNEWHYVKDGDLPSDTTALYSVLVYSWNFGLSHLYERYGIYIPTVCEWNGEYFKALDRGAYTNARNIRSCYAWKEIVLPELKENE